jgi:heme A synthase
MWGALFAVVMPITDGLLAYEAQAPLEVVAKHIATILYLLIIFCIFRKVIAQKPNKKINSNA